MLTDAAIRKASAKDKQFKMSDVLGLYLLVKPNGSKLWRYDYTFAGKRKTLSIGGYPDVSLAQARKHRADARQLLDEGRDPSGQKRVTRTLAATGDTFAEVAAEYLTRFEQRDPSPAEATMIKKRWLIEDIVNPRLGHMTIRDISAAEVLALLKDVEKSGRRETARRMRSVISAVFRHAVTTLRAETDPTYVIRDALTPPKVTSHAAITDEIKFGRLLTAIDEYDGWAPLREILQFMALTFVRPGEARYAAWSEFDLDAKVWTIPAERMKMRREHRVPLARQTLELLRGARAANPNFPLVFPSIRNPRRPLSENSMNVTLRRMGYKKDEHTSHGFRSTASTILNRRKFDPEVIELQLSHVEGSVRRTYNRDLRWEDRVALMQRWANILDDLRLI